MNTRPPRWHPLILLLLLLLPSGWSCQQARPKGHPFPNYVERRVSGFDTFSVRSDGVVFMGDSLTDEAQWGDIFPKIRTFNRGVGADRTEHLLARLDQVTQGKPRMIFILIGTNDLAAGIHPQTIIANYRQILNTIQRQSPGTSVFVQSLLPRQAEYRQRIEQINQSLMRLAQDAGYIYVDLYSAFLGADGAIRDEYSNDALHLLGPGYLKWKEIIAPYIQPDN